MAKALVERDNYDDAQRLISRLEKDPGTFAEILRELPALKAYYFIKQKQYKNAIGPLENAIEVVKDRDQKARYSFITAQVYEMNGQSNEAFAALKNAIKYSTDYEMEFRCASKFSSN